MTSPASNRYSPSRRHYHQALPTSDWREELCELRTAARKRSALFNQMIARFALDSAAVPTEDELNSLICECMRHGETKALNAILAQESPRTLCILERADASAWQTLHDALPAPSEIIELVLSGQVFGPQTSHLFGECLDRMPHLESLRLTNCTLSEVIQYWPALTRLQHLHFEAMQKPYNLLMHILETSSLTTFHLSDCKDSGLDGELHGNLARSLARQTTLRELTLKDLRADWFHGNLALGSYATSLKNQTKLERLDLSFNRLSPKICVELRDALEGKVTLTSLTLAGCWPGQHEEALDWTGLAKLVTLESLVSLDLSGNVLAHSMSPVMMAVASHPRLQHFDLEDVKADRQLVCKVLPIVLEANQKLISLKLPDWPDSDFETLAIAMDKNCTLRCLSIPALEQERESLLETPEIFDRKYPNYVALMDRVARNWRKWDEERFALIEGGMRVLLGNLGGVGLNRVPYDIARYAADVAVSRNGAQDAVVLHRLNRSADQEGSAALARLERERETRAKPLAAQERVQDNKS
ncbi:hypothetical protein [Variovorax soli]|uniref:Ran GTPase-activating protein (RanGAP) involved in mRNA processing and transport n=1 Tax=Variovorax soli TaxID=376815 RepID=A0ABU1NAC5_9BURK|nr:hypothetical protein [Variovorax soli]MDR6535405.1 Ran GTPase-activating protein (RanGAP) involved in mRNA processing and transport [Variovorax soli]